MIHRLAAGAVHRAGAAPSPAGRLRVQRASASARRCGRRGWRAEQHFRALRRRRRPHRPHDARARVQLRRPSRTAGTACVQFDPDYPDAAGVCAAQQGRPRSRTPLARRRDRPAAATSGGTSGLHDWLYGRQTRGALIVRCQQLGDSYVSPNFDVTVDASAHATDPTRPAAASRMEFESSAPLPLRGPGTEGCAVKASALAPGERRRGKGPRDSCAGSRRASAGASPS